MKQSKHIYICTRLFLCKNCFCEEVLILELIFICNVYKLYQELQGVSRWSYYVDRNDQRNYYYVSDQFVGRRQFRRNEHTSYIPVREFRVVEVIEKNLRGQSVFREENYVRLRCRFAGCKSTSSKYNIKRGFDNRTNILIVNTSLYMYVSTCTFYIQYHYNIIIYVWIIIILCVYYANWAILSVFRKIMKISTEVEKKER